MLNSFIVVGSVLAADQLIIERLYASMEFATSCIHHSARFEELTGSVVSPLYLTSTFAHLGLGKSTGYDYTRTQNPTRQSVEDTVALLEQGADALAFSTGMAAIACLMELFKPGDHIVTSFDLYGGSIRLFDSISKKNGLLFTSVDTSDAVAVARAITPATRAILIESPTNPTMVVSDIAEIAQIAHDNDALLIADNTFLSPYFCQPLTLGADIVVHSGSKYLGGHNDVLSGFLVAATQDMADKLRYIQNTTGATLTPFDSWLVERGIKTLPLRMEKHQQNAMEVASFLQGHELVDEVLYPGLSKHPGHELCLRQGTGFGGTITFYVKDEQVAKRLLEGVKLVAFAESLGGAESLITYPLTQTHADLTAEECAAKGIDGRMIRLSLGLEDAKDIIADLEQALATE